MIKALVLTGQGINSHIETAEAFKRGGAEAVLMDIEDFLTLDSLDNFHILAFPGGFSFGDEIRSGKLVAEKIKAHQLENIQKFVGAKKPIIGICNGFQILVQLGIFEKDERTITLAQNNHGRFLNLWVELNTDSTKSLWLKDLPSKLKMPMRHKEGRLVAMSGKTDFQTAFTYTTDVNGSFELTAGITNNEGNVLGLMPHPEAGLTEDLFPDDGELSKFNQMIFTNAVKYCEKMTL